MQEISNNHQELCGAELDNGNLTLRWGSLLLLCHKHILFCDDVSTIQIIVIESIFIFSSRQFYYQLQNKAWKFGFFLKSSFSPIE